MKKNVLISGEVTLETTLGVDSFPLSYEPVQYPFFRMTSSVAGVGVNQGAAYKALGRQNRLMGLIGQDLRGQTILSGLEALGLETSWIRKDLDQSTQSLILYDRTGKRMIFNDLKDIQDRSYPKDEFRKAAEGCEAAVLCNINFNRGLLAEARNLGLPVVTDVHTIADPEDGYNKDFMANADVLFLSNEHFPGREQEFCEALIHRYRFQVLVVGQGSQGASAWDRSTRTWYHSPAVTPRPVVNTIGAGDALSASFTDGWLSGLTVSDALDRACRFAGWKVGAKGAAEGFLSREELDGQDLMALADPSAGR